MPFSRPTRAAAPAADLRGVYCLREPVGGLWAYYAVTSAGQILHRPRPAAMGYEAAFVVSALREELDLLDPAPALSLIHASAAVSPPAASAPRYDPPRLTLRLSGDGRG